MKAWLEGEKVDLEALVKLFPEGDIRVLKDDDGKRHTYYLIAPQIDNPPEPDRFYDAAIPLLNQINGLARIRNPRFRPVTLAHRYTDTNGGDHVVVFAERAEAFAFADFGPVQVTVTDSDGKKREHQPERSPWPDRMALAATNTDVAEALDILGRVEDVGWVELWKLFEIVRESVKPNTIRTLGWTNEPDLEAFKESANRKDVSGDGARHARRPNQPQYRKMELAEGRIYIGRIVVGWMDLLT